MSDDTIPAALQARRLIRGAASATLATSTEGQPFASLVTPAAMPDLSLVLLLSDLSEHTRHLMRDPRCSLLFQGAAQGPNPQTTPRVTVTGLAERLPPDSAAPLRDRYLARHPYAALYAGFGDFALWRVTVQGALLVGGFARAHRLRAAQLAPDPAAVAALAAAEPGVLAHVNADHADALALIATRLLRCGKAEWRLAAVDPDGADIAAGETVTRLDFSQPVEDAGGIRQELVRATAAARMTEPPSE